VKTVIVASTNPVKIDSARAGFTAMFPHERFDVRGVEVESGVSHQPMDSAETLAGALTRALNARDAVPETDFVVGIEGGIERDGGALAAFAWIVVLGREQSGRSRTGSFMLPQEISELVEQGVELGHADDRVFGRSDSKRQNGSVGILTDDVITRVDFYAHAVVLALIPFKHPELRFDPVDPV
jgi:inosine/xanthosine triphosphatase